MNHVILNTAYLPNLTYFYYLINSEQVTIEAKEYYQKQSYRNRCEILSANGILILSVPVKKNAVKELITEKQISYSENWQIKHWRAICSGYKNSAYFEFFEDEFRFFYENKFDFLFEYNFELINLVLKLLKLKKDVFISNSFETKTKDKVDLRESIHPKIIHSNIPETDRAYYQVFSDKFSFQKNLSIIDLLFNKGLETVSYLTVKKTN